MRVTKGDIIIDCATRAELDMALLALSGTESYVRPWPGVTVPVITEEMLVDRPNPVQQMMAGGDCSLGTATLGEYITEEQEQRLRLVPDPYRFGTGEQCGPAGDPGTDAVLPHVPLLQHIEYAPPLVGAPVDLAPEPPAPQAITLDSGSGPRYVPVTRKLLDVLVEVVRFPDGVYARGIGELIGVNRATASSRLQGLKALGLVEHPATNQTKWRATQLARRSKLVAC